MTAVILVSGAAPFLSAGAHASPSDHKCESVRTERKCEGPKG